jgi:hypothetical protein
VRLAQCQASYKSKLPTVSGDLRNARLGGRFICRDEVERFVAWEFC